MDQIPQVTTPFGVLGVPTGGFYTLGLGSEPTIAPEPSPFMTPGSFTAPEPSEPEIPPSPFTVPREPEPTEAAQTAPEPALPTQSPIDPRKVEVFRAIYPLLEELVSEIRRSIEYFRSRHMDADVQTIVLCGGGAIMPSLDQFIATAVGIPTVVGNPFKGVQLQVKRYGPEYVAANAHLMAVAVGMGLHASF
jgi:type IV pilus assembly protein PilM